MLGLLHSPAAVGDGAPHHPGRVSLHPNVPHSENRVLGSWSRQSCRCFPARSIGCSLSRLSPRRRPAQLGSTWLPTCESLIPDLVYRKKRAQSTKGAVVGLPGITGSFSRWSGVPPMANDKSRPIDYQSAAHVFATVKRERCVRRPSPQRPALVAAPVCHDHSLTNSDMIAALPTWSAAACCVCTLRDPAPRES